MIASVNGKVAAVSAAGAVVEVGGVGLAVSCTPGTLARLRVGQPARLSTSLVVREDSLTLYGFADDDERSVFELLQTASGVGPRLAQAVLSVLVLAGAAGLGLVVSGIALIQGTSLTGLAHGVFLDARRIDVARLDLAVDEDGNQSGVDERRKRGRKRDGRRDDLVTGHERALELPRRQGHDGSQVGGRSRVHQREVARAEKPLHPCLEQLTVRAHRQPEVERAVDEVDHLLRTEDATGVVHATPAWYEWWLRMSKRVVLPNLVEDFGFQRRKPPIPIGFGRGKLVQRSIGQCTGTRQVATL